MSDFSLDPSVQNVFSNGSQVTPQIVATRDPVAADNQYGAGTFWFNSSAFKLWSQMGFSLGIPQWELIGTSTGNVDSLTGDTGTATPTAGNIKIGGTAAQVSVIASGSTVTLSLIGPYTPATYTAHGVLVGEGTGSIVALSPGTTGQVLVSNGGSADPSFQTATPQLVVTPVAGTSQAMLSNHTYIANSASLTTFTLPTTSSVGDVLQVVGSALNTGGWKITYTTGQIIWGPAGSSTITTGNAASAAAAAQSVTMTCVVANTTWAITANSGTITLT